MKDKVVHSIKYTNSSTYLYGSTTQTAKTYCIWIDLTISTQYIAISGYIEFVNLTNKVSYPRAKVLIDLSNYITDGIWTNYNNISYVINSNHEPLLIGIGQTYLSSDGITAVAPFTTEINQYCLMLCYNGTFIKYA